jgi:tRNA-dihydrouridine synthase
LRDAAHIRAVFRATGAAAVMLARGALGNPWLFRELVGAGGEEPSACGEEPSACGEEPSCSGRARARGGNRAPTAREIVAELEWVMDRAAEHLGGERAARYLRKFYPWYLARLGLQKASANSLGAALQRTSELESARALLLGATAQVPPAEVPLAA